MEKKKISIALAGNPNSGKTTLFNAITGARQKTGNYPGVTVEKKEGKRVYKNYEIQVIDLPGTYSLTAYSLDEVVTRDFLINEAPDLIVDVLDSTNLERNLFLCLQFQELGIPVIGALNMIDQAEENGIKIDDQKLSAVLKIPFVKTVGSASKGIEDLLDQVISSYESQEVAEAAVSYGSDIEKEIHKLLPLLKQDQDFVKKYPVHWLAVKLIEKDREAEKILRENRFQPEILKKRDECVKWLEGHFGMDSEIAVTEQRYGYIHGAVKEAVSKRLLSRKNITEKIDRVLINRFLGPVFFILIIWGIFQLTFLIGEYPMLWMEMFFSWLGAFLQSVLPAGFIRSLLVDGIIAGVGGVLSFVPLIIILFFFISIMEDTGYMARAAFVMDKFLHIFGLHGQSFMPMMIGFGCSVPAIMAARILKNPKDRIITILVTPFMSCGAKLPVYVLLAGAFFSRYAGNVILSIYIIGVVLALLFAALFRKTVLKGESTPFVMELPPYRVPTAKGIVWHLWGKTWAYIKKAGTVILIAALILWAITSFPQKDFSASEINQIKEEFQTKQLDRSSVKAKIIKLANSEININELEDPAEQDKLKALKKAINQQKITVEEALAREISALEKGYLEKERSSRALKYSIAGRMGQILEPVLRPIGFNWKIGISAVAGFAAKEMIVSTLGILYSVGSEEGAESQSLRQALIRDPQFNALTAYCLMLFTLIIAPCFATLSVIRSELGWKWLLFAIFYMCTAAWLIAFVVYQIGSLAGLGI